MTVVLQPRANPLDALLQRPCFALGQPVAVEAAELGAQVIDRAAQASGFALGNPITQIAAIDAVLKLLDLLGDRVGVAAILIVAIVAAVVTIVVATVTIVAAVVAIVVATVTIVAVFIARLRVVLGLGGDSGGERCTRDEGGNENFGATAHELFLDMRTGLGPDHVHVYTP